MNRRSFLKDLAYTLPAASFLPSFNSLAAKEVKTVRITDVKCVRTLINFRVSPLVKIETDAGIVESANVITMKTDSEPKMWC